MTGINSPHSFELNFYPWNQWNKYKDLIVDAKKQTGVTEKVIPQEAKPGCGRVICVEPPPFLCDYALIQSGSVKGFTAALLWLFNIKEDERVITVQQMLSRIMGGEVFEHLQERDYGDRLINPQPAVLVDKNSSVEHRPREADGDSAGYLW